MSKSKAPAFQFYVNDWLGSTHIMLMTPAEEGAYIRLLAIAWNSEDCGLPDDDEQLSVLSRLGEGWLKGGSNLVRKCFFSKDGRLYNSRLLSERKKQDAWRKKSKEGGKASGKARKNKTLQNKGWLKGGSTKDEPKGNSSSSSSSSSSLIKKNNKKKSSAPESFKITSKLKKWAEDKGCNKNLEELTEAFLDHHRAKGNLFIDWIAAWRTWVRNDVKFERTSKPKSEKDWRDYF